MGYHPNFCFSSRTQAERDLSYRVRTKFMDPRVHVIVEEAGKFALVPRHAAHEFGIKIEVESFANRDRVFWIVQTTRHGTITKAGPEVCEVKWDDGRVSNEANYYIGKLAKPAKRERVKPLRRVE